LAPKDEEAVGDVNQLVSGLGIAASSAVEVEERGGELSARV
jgi:hypothetical protein